MLWRNNWLSACRELPVAASCVFVLTLAALLLPAVASMGCNAAVVASCCRGATASGDVHVRGLDAREPSPNETSVAGRDAGTVFGTRAVSPPRNGPCLLPAGGAEVATARSSSAVDVRPSHASSVPSPSSSVSCSCSGEALTLGGGARGGGRSSTRRLAPRSLLAVLGTGRGAGGAGAGGAAARAARAVSSARSWSRSSTVDWKAKSCPPLIGFLGLPDLRPPGLTSGGAAGCTSLRGNSAAGDAGGAGAIAAARSASTVAETTPPLVLGE